MRILLQATACSPWLEASPTLDSQAPVLWSSPVWLDQLGSRCDQQRTRNEKANPVGWFFVKVLLAKTW